MKLFIITGTEREGLLVADCLKEAFRTVNGRNLIIVTCMAPHDCIT